MTQDTRETIVVTSPIPDELRAALGARHRLVALDDMEPDAPVRIAATTSMGGFDAATMDRLPHLQLIACNGAGLDRIDVAGADARGIVVANTPGVLTEDVADAAIGLMYAVARRIVEADRFVRAGRWGPEKMPLSRRIAGGRAGIVGMGQIGQAIARRCAGLGLSVAYTAPRAKPEVPWTHVPELADLAERVDVLFLACPGGDATRGIVDGGIIAALGATGFLVNVSRGEVVDEEALIAALQAGALGGAALDVFVREPGLDPRLLTLDNVVLQPHYAGLTTQTRADIAATLVGAVDRFLGTTTEADASV